jgi:hypothetical protein
MTLTMRPAGLSSGVYKDSVDYGIFWASGASAGYTRTGAAQRNCAGCGRCTHPADEKLCAPQIKCPR